MDNEKEIVDLRSSKYLFDSFSFEDGEIVTKLIFDDKIIILNEEQTNNFWGNE